MISIIMKSELPSRRAICRYSNPALLHTRIIRRSTVAALTGPSEHDLRYYERVGLLEPVHRDPTSGYHRYSPGDLVRCETLTCLRAAGLSLDEMRRYFELRS